MYHLFFVALLILSTDEFFSTTARRTGLMVSFFLLCFVSLRYGQGSDYFSYIYLFNYSADNFELLINTGDIRYITQELGFSAISFLWLKVLNLTPELLTALYSATSYLLVWLFIKKYSPNPIISLFFFYCTFYLIYPFSAIRQAICISIFIYFLVPLLHQKKYAKYYLFSFLLFTIHFSSIVLFILPVVNLIKRYTPRQVYVLSLASLVVGLILYQSLFSFFSQLDMIGSRVEAYTGTTSIDILSLLLRTVIFVPVMLTYKLYERNSIRDLFLKIYILGFFLYLIFMSSTLISSRINVYMRFFEIIILVDFLFFTFKKQTNRIVCYGIIFLTMSVLYVKNIDSFINQGPYYGHVNLYNYPYVSVFNKKKIIETRNIPTYYQEYVISE